MSAFAKTTLLLLVLAAVLTGCSEIPPTLNPAEGGLPNDTIELENQPRGVLIEEFTGVRCVNCPAGADAIEDLASIHGNRLVPVSYHAGFFANPYNESNQDFRTGAADAIQSYVGEPQGYPSAVVDRFQFSGEQSLQLGRDLWAGYIGQRLALSPTHAIGLEAEVDSVAAQLDVEVEVLQRIDAGPEPVFLTVLVLEDDVVDMQLTPEGKDSTYVHQHVFRAALTPPLGVELTDLTTGSSLTRTFSYPIPAAYDASSLSVVAVVHHAGGEKAILQAVGSHAD